jgi:hypothetical protein
MINGNRMHQSSTSSLIAKGLNNYVDKGVTNKNRFCALSLLYVDGVKIYFGKGL